MIVGTGLDLVEVARIRALAEKHGDRFLKRVFTGRELEDWANRASRWERLAGRFAAKEAAFKALGTGWASGVSWRQVEILNEPGGRPVVTLTGAARERAEALGASRVHLSISHTAEHAAAQVVLESAD